MSMFGGWIGVDLDGTLAQYGTWSGIEHVGDPVPLMAERVKGWIAEGKDVRIMTARVCHLYLANASEERRREAEYAREIIQQWTMKHFGQRLPVTSVKDFSMIELWDDRCVQIEPNTGRRMDGSEDGFNIVDKRRF